MNAISPACTARRFSKLVRIMLVNVAESMRNISHGMRFFHISIMPDLEYGLSDGVIPAMISKSSVVSWAP